MRVSRIHLTPAFVVFDVTKHYRMCQKTLKLVKETPKSLVENIRIKKIFVSIMAWTSL